MDRGARPSCYQAITNTVIAVIGIIVAFPLMLLTALAVRFSSPGPVLYRQTRVGLERAPFTLYKFRSMRADAEIGDRRRLGGQGRPARDRRGPHHPQDPLR